MYRGQKIENLPHKLYSQHQRVLRETNFSPRAVKIT